MGEAEVGGGHRAADHFGEGAAQGLDHLFLRHVDVLPAPGAAGVQHPGVQLVVAARLAAVAGQPGQRAFLDEAALYRRLQRFGEAEGDGPARLHGDARRGGRQLRRAGQQRRGLRSRGGDQHAAERPVGLAFGVLQVPVLFTAVGLGDAAAEGGGQVVEQGAGDRAHARRADPARLLVRGRTEVAVAVFVERRGPLRHPALLAPFLHGFEETAVAGGEILRAEVEDSRLAALAGHAPAGAVTLVEQLDILSGVAQGMGGGKAGDTGANDGDGGAHDVPLHVSLFQVSELLGVVQRFRSVQVSPTGVHAPPSAKAGIARGERGGASGLLQRRRGSC
ncbi:hypothetical protein D3C76_478840 [compost metagenome]